MAIQSLNVPTLKKVKNSVIGNPTAKREFSQNEEFIALLIDCITNPARPFEESQGSTDDIRVEAAHVVASLSYGSSSALRSLLRFNAHQAFVNAVSTLRPTDPPQLKVSFLRALRALAAAFADEIGPSKWGLRSIPSDIREEAAAALNYLFQAEVLDVYLPFLNDSSIQTSTHVAELVASAVRTPEHRIAIAQWLPSSERIQEVKGKRGWEKASTSAQPCRQGGWFARNLVLLLPRRDAKFQEAALYALAYLADNNPTVASSLAMAFLEQESTLNIVLVLCKSRHIDLQLAACLCATSISRSGYTYHPLAAEHTPPFTVLHVLSRIIASDNEKMTIRTKACFILYNLVTDHKELCRLAFDHDSLEKLATLVKSVTPTDKKNEWEDEEPESISRLREAALTAIAAIALFDDDIREAVADRFKLIPCIQTSLSHSHVGVRYAACHCVRALSRSVAVLRTNIIDSGLGMAVYQLFMKLEEDRRVTYAASAVICNLVNEFCPLRPVLLNQGMVPRLVQLLNSGDSGLRLNALWTLKNLLYKASTEVKRTVMDAVGWHALSHLLSDADPGVQETAIHVMRNIADQPEDIEMLFAEVGCDCLLECIADEMSSENEDLVQQAVCLLANLVNSPSYHEEILLHQRLLPVLRSCLTEGRVETRRPAVMCVAELAKDPRSHQPLNDAGIYSTLHHLVEHSGGGVGSSPTRRPSLGTHMGAEDDFEVKDKAREALKYLISSYEILGKV